MAIAERGAEVGMKHADGRLEADREASRDCPEDVLAVLGASARRPVWMEARTVRLIPLSDCLDHRASHEHGHAAGAPKDIPTFDKSRRSIPPELGWMPVFVAADPGD